MKRTLTLPTPHGHLRGEIDMPVAARGLALLIRPRPQALEIAQVAGLLNRGFAVLRFALLTGQEAAFPDAAHNIPKLTQRLLEILALIRDDGELRELPLGLVATGDATPAAIRAAARRDTQVHALACLGGQADRAGVESLEMLKAPLLLLIGADDAMARQASERAERHLHGIYRIAETPAGDLSTRLAEWFVKDADA